MNAVIPNALKMDFGSFKKITPATIKKIIQITVAGSGFFEKRGCIKVGNLLINFSLSWL